MKIKLLAVLTQEQRKMVTGLACNKTSVLFKHNDLCQNLGVVVSGNVQILISSSSGNDVIYEDLHEGDIFGGEFLFSTNETYKGDVIALGKTTVALISKENALEFMATNKDFLKEYLRITSDQSILDKGLVKILDRSEIEDRLLTFIKLSGRQLKMKSIQDTASKIHVTREALSRTIKKLVEKQVITKEGNVLKIVK